ncbi:MAG: ABC transporter ATP-binding protein [Alphaproteobacteria bacterium]|nr:ABC transporter ATP-binding protein [Alphaproteobacteria bacterium]
MLLKAKKISKRYQDLIILENIDFQLNEGEMVAILGASGSGKSTFLHVISTLDAFDNGTLFYKNAPLNTNKSSRISHFRNQEVGFIFQDHHLLQEFTALENVIIPGLIGNRPPKELKLQALELFRKIGLENRTHHLPAELSGGEQQRVATIRAIINNPKIIFADEPTGNLDAQNAEIIENLFFDLNKTQNISFVIVTHNLELASRCHKIYTLKNKTLTF